MARETCVEITVATTVKVPLDENVSFPTAIATAQTRALELAHQDDREVLGRNDGDHPKGGRLGAKGACVDCGRKPRNRHRPCRHRASALGRRIATLDYEGPRAA